MTDLYYSLLLGGGGCGVEEDTCACSECIPETMVYEPCRHKRNTVCVCVCVCMCMCACVCACVCVRAHMYDVVFVCVYACGSMSLCTSASMPMSVPVPVSLNPTLSTLRPAQTKPR